MEKIMSKSNDNSTRDHRPLADNELDAVSGGFGLLGGIPGTSAPQSQILPPTGMIKFSKIDLK
jgi:hypothetical protein